MATVKKTAFGSAFAEARAKGDRTFEFGGKKYTTAQKGESGKQTVTALSKAYEKTTGLPQNVAQVAPKAVSSMETQPMKREAPKVALTVSPNNMFSRMAENKSERLRSRANKFSAPMANADLDKAARLREKASTPGLFSRIGERIKQRQLARAERLGNKGVGSPMKSETNVPSTPSSSSEGLTNTQRSMLNSYLSRKKYMGGGKMKSYAKGGMIEKEGMKPNGKMDKKKAFMEMIAKLKAKKK